MATWKIHRFRSDRDLCEVLNGAITSNKDAEDGLLVDGLTLLIDAGGGVKTVTFAPALSRAWTLEEIVATIEAADASLVGVACISRGLTAGSNGTPSYLRLVKDNGAAITVKSTGTANALFGFSVTVDTVGVPYVDTEVESRIGMIDNKTWYAVTYK